MSRIRAVFFDLGGTLFSNRQIPLVCTPVLEEAATRLGVEGGIAGIARQFVEATQAVNAEYVERPFYLHRDLFIDTSRSMSRALGREESEEFDEWLYQSQRAAIVERLRLRRDCLETLEALRSKGLVLTVVSNIDDDYLEPMMVNLGLDKVFDHWISSEAASSCKPHAGIFEFAMRKVGLGPEEVIFVGDSRVHDIQGARGVGIRSVLISEPGGVSHLDDEHSGVQPDHQIGTLSELLELEHLSTF
jgi:HAD superfamily hydrolase (TIGR01509 family)